MTQMHFGKDFAEILAELSAAGAEFLVVGGHAKAAHRISWAARNLELWVRPTSENARRVWGGLKTFGVPLQELTVDDFAAPGSLIRLGGRIDILTSFAGVAFDEAWSARTIATMGGALYPVMSPQ